jgi:hypothetical protein
VTRALAASELLRLPVRLHGLKLGSPIELLLDAGATRAIGLELVCGDGAHRFLPFAAARLGEDELTLTSALMLLEERDVGFYRANAVPLGGLRGRPVERDGAPLGTLADLELAADGSVVALVLAVGEGTRRVPLDGTVRILERPRSSAA